MLGIQKEVSLEDAREELEAVASSLARTPRLEQLLRYLVQRYFEGDAAELTEYNIATEVFGRKKTEFMASQDAIARVETHRLRKKLTAFYDGPGRDHAVRITIPLGTYVPHIAEHTVTFVDPFRDQPDDPEALLFVPSETALLGDAAGAAEKTFTESSDPAAPATHAAAFRRWMPQTAAALLLCALALAGLFVLRYRATSAQAAATQEEANPAAATLGAVAPAVAGPVRTGAAAPVAIPFRMLAGYTGAPQRDDEGDVWQADQYYDGGWARHQSKAFIKRTGNPFLFRYGRDGDIAYNIPMAPGAYEVHLFFMQGSDTNQSEDAENKTFFNVHVNGEVVLANFDIVSDANGREVGDERVIRDVSPAADGFLHLQLSTVLGTPSVCAIEILAAGSHGQLPLRLVMQPASFTDRHGQLWRPDDFYLGGRNLSHNVTEAGADDDVMPFERYGHFDYALPVDPRDRYTVKLRFVELYFGTREADRDQQHRLFKVICNGETLLDDFDIVKEAGSLHTLEKTFHHLKPSAQGKLNLEFQPIQNYATVSSIEVIDEAP